MDVFIVSSNDIIPYDTCIDGIKESLSGYELQKITIKEDVEEGSEALQNIKKKNPKLIIAVGPQAAFVLSKEKSPPLRLFCMILNPVKLLGQSGLFPGISLNIPPQFQLQKIKAAFPERKKIGIFFNKESNQSIMDSFHEEAKKLDLVIASFPVSSANDIPSILSSKDFAIDVLLIIPDDQVGSTKIVEYLIKESLRRRIPVTGYNSWFAKNGAVLSFIVDYKNMGLQTGNTAKIMLSAGASHAAGVLPPEKVKITVDVKTAEKLGVKLSSSIIKQADEVIQ